MDIDRLVKESQQATNTLTAIWDEVGFPPSVRARHFVTLSDMIGKVYSKYVEDETIVRDEYRSNVLSLQKEAETLEKILGLNPISGPAHSSLMVVFDFYSKRVDELKQQRNVRLNEILALKEKLSFLQSELGEGLEFSFSEDNMAPEVVEDLRSEIVECETLKASRSIHIDGVVAKINALCQDLAEDAKFYTTRSGYSSSMIATLEARLKELEDLRNSRMASISDKLMAIKDLWNRLDVHEDHRNSIVCHTGLSKHTIEILDQEYSRLLELKAVNLRKLIASAQAEIERLWDELCVTDVDREIHSQAFAGDYSEESLSAREALIANLNKKLQLVRPIVQMIQKRETWIKEKQHLSVSVSQMITSKKSSANLHQALQQENMIKNHLPSLEEKLHQSLREWVAVHGEPFFYNGVDYLVQLQHELESKPPKPVPASSRLAGPTTPAKALTKPAALPEKTPQKTPAKALSARTPGVTPLKRSITMKPPQTPTTEMTKKFEFASISTPKANPKKRANPNTKTPDAKRPKSILSPISTNIAAEAREAEDREEL